MVKAIDAQQAIVQLEQTGRVLQVQQQHPEMQQRYFELHLQEEKKRLREKVNDTEDSDKVVLREREEGTGKGSGGKQRGKAEGESPEGMEEASPLQGGLVDITV